MKRLFIFSTFLLCLLSTTFSQQSDNTIKPNLKYGKPSKEELTMTSFAPDTTATAYADIQIPYYSNGRNPTLKENVSQLALFLDFRKQVAKQFNNKVTTKKRNAERYSDRIELQGFQSCFRLFVKPSQSPLKPNQDAATLLVRNHARNGDKRTRITKQGVKD